MPETAFTAVILAAGKGTRMQSALPKVLHEVAGLPMLAHVIAANEAAGARAVVLVTAPPQEDVRAAADEHSADIIHVVQPDPRGTGEGVLLALPHCGDGRVVNVFGDAPLLRPEIIAELAGATTAVTVLGFRPDDMATYGRIRMDGDRPAAIVEFKELAGDDYDLDLCNGGAMGASVEALAELLPHLTNDNPQGEYLLPHVVGLASAAGMETSLVMTTPDDTLGVDTRIGLARAEKLMQSRLRAALLEKGVSMPDPDSVFLCADTEIAGDVMIEPFVKFGRGVKIGAGSVIKSFSHLEGVSIGRDVMVGPHARLRPETHIGDGARIGNFVEIKKARIGAGSKVNHLSYIGDAELGEDVNIGAGTITCNYDGYRKHTTEIGDGAFIGSNTALIAPVKIGAGAYLGSGADVSKDVEADSLVVTRGERRDVAGWAAAFRRRNEKG